MSFRRAGFKAFQLWRTAAGAGAIFFCGHAAGWCKHAADPVTEDRKKLLGFLHSYNRICELDDGTRVSGTVPFIRMSELETEGSAIRRPVYHIAPEAVNSSEMELTLCATTNRAVVVPLDMPGADEGARRLLRVTKRLLGAARKVAQVGLLGSLAAQAGGGDEDAMSKAAAEAALQPALIGHIRDKEIPASDWFDMTRALSGEWCVSAGSCRSPPIPHCRAAQRSVVLLMDETVTPCTLPSAQLCAALTPHLQVNAFVTPEIPRSAARPSLHPAPRSRPVQHHIRALAAPGGD